MLHSNSALRGYFQESYLRMHFCRLESYLASKKYSALSHYSQFPIYPLGNSLLYEVVCFLRTSLFLSILQNLLSFGPSQFVYIHSGTMTSADFCQFSHTSLHEL